MITGDLKNKIDNIWETFWTGGLANPLSVIEQVTYLLFIKLLDDNQIKKERNAQVLGVEPKNLLFKAGNYVDEKENINEPYINLEMWLICLIFAVSLFVCITIRRAVQKKLPKELWQCIKRSPWELVPFVLSMFIIVLALQQNGVSGMMAEFLGKGNEVITYGVGTYLFSNIINNIPASKCLI